MLRAYPEDVLNQNQNNKEIRVVYIPVVENQNNFDKILIFGMIVIAAVVCLTILFKK